MKAIFTKKQVDDMITLLSGDRSVLNGLTRPARRYLLHKSQYYRVRGDKLYCIRGEFGKEVVGCDDAYLIALIEQVHLPDHLGMKAVYLRLSLHYTGFRREIIDKYVGSCPVCLKYEPRRKRRVVE